MNFAKPAPMRTSKPSTTTKSGAADEEMFMNAFEDVPRVQLFSNRDLEQEITKIRETLSDSNIDWEKRLDSLRRIRSLLVAGAAQYDEFYGFLKPLELSFQVSLKDLRSQVVREACITIAFLSQLTGIKCGRFMEALLPFLINLIQSSAKIMSSSAIVAIRFIIQHTHFHRLIPTITYNLSSKAKEIRKTCCEFLDQMLHTWPNHALEKHVGDLQEAIKKGMNDADPEARSFSRRAFWGFADKFKQEADYLLNSLDSSKQRMLRGEHVNMSNNSNCANPHQYPGRPPLYRAGSSVSSSSSVENLARPPSGLSQKNRSGIPTIASKPEVPTRPSPSLRTTSAIDVSAARRAKARQAALTTAVPQPKPFVTGGYSLTRTTNPTPRPPTSTATPVLSPERISRSQTRVSQSQPGSRSASPSARLNYYTTQMQSDGKNQRIRRKSSIPLSTSREVSPNRLTGYASFERRISTGNRSRQMTPSIERTVPVMAEKILQQSKEAEAAMESALRTAVISDTSPLKRLNTYENDHSDESETSSLCSDMSFGSFGGRKMEDVSEIIQNLSSNHWSDRKEGLLGLALLFRHSSRTLNAYELQKITDIFTKMLLDPHTKTFTLFLDVLNDLIQIYKTELNSWLYVLMTRLFLKIGSDTLGSIQTKILKTFELIRESFVSEDQFNVIIRFLSDQTQTPNAKVKVAVLQYLINLIPLMDPSELSSNSRNNHEIQLTLMKIISWTADPKSQDLRKISQDVIVDLFNLNSAEMSYMIIALPKTYQDAALQTIHLKRRSKNSTALSALSPSSILKPPSLLRHHTPTNTSKFNYYDETENLNPEDIYNSLKQTTDEIQKYNFEVNSEFVFANSEKKPAKVTTPTTSPKRTTPPARNLRELSLASQDSGISQIDGIVIGNNKTPNISPIKSVSPPLISAENHVKISPFNNSNNNSTNGSTNFSEIICNLRSNLKEPESRKEALSELVEMIRDGNASNWTNHFNDVLRLLLDLMSEDTISSIRAPSLKVMCELLTHRTKYFHDYIELTILRILEASKASEKEVVRASECCAGTAAAILPPQPCLQVLNRVITTCESPMNIAAIKMISKLVEQQPLQIVYDLLPEMMPPLVIAYDHSESAVRKAAVFCMVSIYGVVGEAMKEHLTSLNGSKMKLLKLYIERAKAQSASSTTATS